MHNLKIFQKIPNHFIYLQCHLFLLRGFLLCHLFLLRGFLLCHLFLLSSFLVCHLFLFRSFLLCRLFFLLLLLLCLFRQRSSRCSAFHLASFPPLLLPITLGSRLCLSSLNPPAPPPHHPPSSSLFGPPL